MIASTPDAQLAGVVTASSAQHVELARDQPGVTGHPDMAGLIAAGMDSLVIVPSFGKRVVQVWEALQQGLPVVCAASLARTLAEAQDLMAMAARWGVLLCSPWPDYCAKSAWDGYASSSRAYN